MSVSGNTDDAIVTHQFQVVTSIGTDVPHDVAVGHPLGNHGESPILKGVGDSNEIENVGMEQVLPHDNLLAEPLHSM